MTIPNDIMKRWNASKEHGDQKAIHEHFKGTDTPVSEQAIHRAFDTGKACARTIKCIDYFYNNRPTIMAAKMDTLLNDNIVNDGAVAYSSPETKPIILWARKCNATGQGMNIGYCFGDGDRYFRLAKDAGQYAVKLGYENLMEAYADEAYYFTEWEMPFDAQYEEIDGKLIEYEPANMTK